MACKSRWWTARPRLRSGLRTRDVITHVGDVAVFDTDDLMLNIGKLPADAGVRLTVDRDGQPQVIVVHELAKSWVEGRKVVTNPAPAWRGLTVDYITASAQFTHPTSQRRFDVQGSVLVTDVEARQPGMERGIAAQHGDHPRGRQTRHDAEAISR